MTKAVALARDDARRERRGDGAGSTAARLPLAAHADRHDLRPARTVGRQQRRRLGERQRRHRARTLDRGATWQNVSPPGTASLGFRDVEAFDADNAVIMSIGEGPDSRVYWTADGGAHWTLAFQNQDRPRSTTA